MVATPLLDGLTDLLVRAYTWHEDDRPVLVADDGVHRIRELDTTLDTTRATVVGVNQHDLEHLARHLRARGLRVYEMRAADLAPLASMGPLTRLVIEWNTKATSLEPLGGLVSLEVLSIVDVPKAHDLGPIGRLRRLRAFEFSGGIWNKNVADTLAPLAALDSLEELRLANLRVLEGGLRPLAGCRSLRSLELSNQFATADYAFLSVALPGTDCDRFVPYVPLRQPIADKDVMVVGSGKPYLNASRDAARLQRYVDAFRRLQEQAASEIARG